MSPLTTVGMLLSCGLMRQGAADTTRERKLELAVLRKRWMTPHSLLYMPEIFWPINYEVLQAHFSPATPNFQGKLMAAYLQ